MESGAPELEGGVRSRMTDRERLLDELRPVANDTGRNCSRSCSPAVMSGVLQSHHPLRDLTYNP